MRPRSHLDQPKAHLLLSIRTSPRYVAQRCFPSSRHTLFVGESVARRAVCANACTDLLPVHVLSLRHLRLPLERSCKHDQACGM